MTTIDPTPTAHDDPSNATARHPATDDARGADAATRDAFERLAAEGVAVADNTGPTAERRVTSTTTRPEAKATVRARSEPPLA
ncbi:hypothetical protein [Micromonospora sp. NPDC002717]|uniref:hypothetical protein n=1 Tax=Micromonospora sp. NPDC002717 TaxID=3154424 RepID=UPI00332AA809